MATNPYCTVLQVQDELGLSGTQGLTKVDTAIAAASRAVDRFCGRRFWQDSALVTREYFADNSLDCMVDDISTATGLIVKTDLNSTGTFDTTLTITTNFILLPTNAADEVPVQPYTQIRVVDAGVSQFPVWNNGRPGVQITAKFGWPAVPDDVTKATIIQACQLYKAGDAVFGGLSFGDGTSLRVRNGLNPMAESLLEYYCKPRVA